jgi:hypothetical protein
VLGNLQVYTHLDYKGGHYLFNMTEQTSMTTDLNHPKANDPTIDRDEWLLLRWGGNAPYIERADFIKLREVSVRYSVPDTMSRRFGADGPRHHPGRPQPGDPLDALQERRGPGGQHRRASRVHTRGVELRAHDPAASWPPVRLPLLGLRTGKGP